jgi:5-formyltetrahydrofolate cyclo-ligase
MDDAREAAQAKGALRSGIRQSRAQRTSNKDDAARIAQHVLDIAEVQHACSRGLPVACYVSRSEEPSTDVLRARLVEAGAVLLLPRIDGDDLVWVRATPDTRWTVNRWGIDEPTGPAFEGTPSVWLIPALAIDADGYRLGQGGGFYDRALRDIAEETSVIAIVFEDEAVESVPRESHDHRVDVVVTPERVRWLSMPD